MHKIRKCSVIVFTIAAISVADAQQYHWRPDFKLDWTLFKAAKNTSNLPNAAAYTYCGWNYNVVKSSDPKGMVSVKIQTVFDAAKSWKDVNNANDYILNHEQKHFDICEWFARQLRGEVEAKIKNSGDFDRYFQNIYSRHQNAYRNFQMLYDRETYHGTNHNAQAKYDSIIAEGLIKTQNLYRLEISK